MSHPKLDNANVLETISFNLPQQQERLKSRRADLLRQLATIQANLASIELHILVSEAMEVEQSQPRELVGDVSSELQLSPVDQPVRAGDV